MQVFLDLDIRRDLGRYLRNEITLDELTRQLASATMDAEQTGSPVAADLLYEIQLRLAEFTDGFWTESDLRAMFASLAGSVDLVSPGLSRVWSHSESQARHVELRAVLR